MKVRINILSQVMHWFYQSYLIPLMRVSMRHFDDDHIADLGYGSVVMFSYHGGLITREQAILFSTRRMGSNVTFVL